MTLRRDHVAGGAFIVAGALVFALSDDLPFGTLASPGAGMMPKLTLTALIVFGAILFLRARESPPFADIAWSDLSHAARVIGIAAAAIAFYTTAGFLPTMMAMLFVLMFVVERKPLVAAAVISVGVTIAAYVVFDTLLKAPLPRTPIWF